MNHDHSRRLRRTAISSALVAALACLSGASHAAERVEVTLDTGVKLVVDNMSGWPTEAIQPLVLAADRSTRDGCPYDAPDAKGLIRSGDRVVVSNHYVAWLDMTAGDGASYGQDMPAKYSRGGALAGYWSLDPVTKTFRNMTPASSENCGNWPRNELIPGSNSPADHSYFWDKYGPPTEHVVTVVTKRDDVHGDAHAVFAHNRAQGSSKAQWKLVTDGQINRDGSLYFKTSARMTSLEWNTDITDNDDANGVTAVLNSEVEYYFRPTDILNAWSFSPSVDIEADAIFVFYWVAYSGQDMDGTLCDQANVAADLWPAKTTMPAWYAQGSMPLVPTFATGGYPAGHQFAAGTPVKMVVGGTCVPGGPNQDLNSWKAGDPNSNVVVDGAWFRVGDSLKNGAPSGRYLTYVHQMPHPNGTGTRANPIDVKYRRFLAWNETHDGTFGFGVASGPYSRAQYMKFSAGKWYHTLHALSSAF